MSAWSAPTATTDAASSQLHQDWSFVATHSCPFAVDNICGEAFAFRAAVQRLDGLLAAGSS